MRDTTRIIKGELYIDGKKPDILRACAARKNIIERNTQSA